MRFFTSCLLILWLAAPTLEVGGRRLWCAERELPSMALEACCCLEAETPQCTPAHLKDCCCQMRPAWRLAGNDQVAVRVPGLRPAPSPAPLVLYSLPAPFLPGPAELRGDISSCELCPAPLYILKASLLI